jgi:hypothetical protein
VLAGEDCGGRQRQGPTTTATVDDESTQNWEADYNGEGTMVVSDAVESRGAMMAATVEDGGVRRLRQRRTTTVADDDGGG